MTDDLPHPGPIIERARKALDWGPTRLAAEAGTTRVTIHRIETRKSRGHPDTLVSIANALGLDPSVLLAGAETDSVIAHDPTPNHEGPSRQAHEPPRFGAKPHTIKNFVDVGPEGIGDTIIGPLGLAAESGPAVGLLKALKTDAQARDGAHTSGAARFVQPYRTLRLAGIPDGCEVVEARVPIEVRIEGQIKLYHPAGRLLIVDSTKAPMTQDVQLVIALHDPDPFAKPTKANPHPEHGMARLMRYEPGPRGNQLLYPLNSDEAVTTNAGWRIQWVVVEDRSAPWPEAGEEELG